MIFTEKITVPYYDTNIKRYASPEKLLAYMGEVATLHSNEIGLTIDDLRENNYGWMLNRWKVKINDYPSARDIIKIKTWPSDFRKFYANREFKILDNQNRELVKASSVWIFLDMIKKRPIRVTDQIIKAYDMEGDILFNELYDFNIPFETDRSMDFSVRKSDIDYNNHVNNVEYFRWMLESLPAYIDEEYELKEFEILYKKEVGLGSLINSSNCEKLGNEEIIFLHKIEEEGEIKALGRTIWEKAIIKINGLEI